LPVARHLINPCGVPGWTGTRRRATTMNATDKSSNTTVHTTVMTACGPGSGAFDTADDLVGSVPADCRQLTGVWNSPPGIRTVYPYTLFNKSPLQLRRIGALGGKAHGRNQRARRALMPTPPAATPLRSASRQSTAEAVAALDVQFPWLCGAEKRPSRKLPPSRLKCTFRTPRKG
jgi:hypothetical protein